MGAVFRKSKKKKQIPSIVETQVKANSSLEEKKIDEKKTKKDKMREQTLKVVPIPESFHENLTTNENKEKDKKKIDNFNFGDAISNISSIQNMNNLVEEKKESDDQSIQRIDNDFVEVNNEQMENNPHFFQVFLKDPGWANKNIAKKLKEFKWPDKGFVEIKTFCFEIKYDYMVKGFKVIKNNDNIHSSILSWVKIPEEDYFSFDLKDINRFNLKTGQVQQNKRMNDGLKFGVDLDGNFLGLDSEKFNDKSYDQEILSFIDLEMELFWNSFVGHWTSIDFNNATDKIHGKSNYFGREAVSLSKENSVENEEIVDFLTEKFRDPNGFKQLMKSPYLIPNDLKKWHEYELSTNVFDIHKLKFYMAENFTNNTGLIGLEGARPFILSFEKTKKIVFEYDGDLFAEISQSLKTMIVLWKDIKETQREEFLLSEASNFRDLCAENLKQILIEITEINNLPLNYRPKFIHQEYDFEKEEEKSILK